MPANILDEIPHLKKLLDEVSTRKGFKQPTYEVTVGTKPGDNYVGCLYRATVAEAEDRQEPLSLVLKTAPSSPKRREMMQSVHMFRNEARMYDTVLESHARLLADKGVIPQESAYPDAPECLLVSLDGAGDQDTIVLRDMRPNGFVMQDRKKGLDVEHCLLVVRTLARLHACSMAREQLDPEQAKTMQGAIRELFFYKGSPFENAFVNTRKRALEAFFKRFPKGSSEFARLKSFVDNYHEEMSAAVTPDPEGGNCILHGDCWVNNFLFKYDKESGSVDTVCLLDFQISRYCSPVPDLMYFLFICTEREMRKKHYDAILRAYHDALQDNLRQLGCEPDKILSWDRMQRHLKRCGKFGIGSAMMVCPVILADSDEIPDLNTEFENGRNMGDILKTSQAAVAEKLHKRLCDVAQDMLELGYL